MCILKMTTKDKERWRPKNCHFRYSTIYDIPTEVTEKPLDLDLSPAEPIVIKTSESKLVDSHKKWCACCMNTAVEPMEFPCGHTFCRSCIAHTWPYLMQEYPEQIKDRRSVMQCPITGCTKVDMCFPVINGDIRFVKQHSRNST